MWPGLCEDLCIAIAVPDEELGSGGYCPTKPTAEDACDDPATKDGMPPAEICEILREDPHFCVYECPSGEIVETKRWEFEDPAPQANDICPRILGVKWVP